MNQANLEFFRANEAEIDQMSKEMQAQAPKETSGSGEGEAEDSTE